jgi:hypothetical protein
MNCSICNENLNSTNKTGLCHKHYQVKWRSEHKDYMKLKKKEYEKNNKQKIQLIKKNHYTQNKQHILKNQQEWYESNKTKLESRYNKAKSTSKQRKIDFNLTFEEYESLIKSATCHYCKSDLSNMVGHGLDRVNSEVGYNIDNVLPCCNTCNKARNTFFTVKEWEVAIKAILNLREENEQYKKV